MEPHGGLVDPLEGLVEPHGGLVEPWEGLEEPHGGIRNYRWPIEKLQTGWELICNFVVHRL